MNVGVRVAISVIGYLTKPENSPQLARVLEANSNILHVAYLRTHRATLCIGPF